MDASHTSALIAAVASMADQLDSIDIGDVFAGFTCTELDSIASVLAIAGHRSTAAFIVARHAEDDDGGDAHGYISDLIDAHGRNDSEVKAASNAYVQGLLDQQSRM